MLPDIPVFPRPALAIPEPLAWDGGTAVDPDGAVVTITECVITGETDLVEDEDGQEEEVALPARTVWDVRINGIQRSVHDDPAEARRAVEQYRVSPGGLVGWAEHMESQKGKP
jgi:hypothetical protein